MGGYGSGFNGYRKITTSECLNLYVNKIHIKRNSKFIGTISFDDNNKSYIGIKKIEQNHITISYSVTMNGNKKDYEYNIYLEYTPCNYGNERAWFICPQCGKRVGILYMRNGVFCCRSCQNLNYYSQRCSGNNLNVIAHRIYKIQHKLNMTQDPLAYWGPKPKGLHYKTYDKLLIQMKNLYEQRERQFMIGVEKILGYKY